MTEVDADPLERIARLPRHRLAPFPTPLVPAPELGAAIGLRNLWFKRDDLIAFGFGGNKIRGLEFLLGEALARDCDIVLTGAGPASNHVRATAASAAHVGREMIAVYWGHEPARVEGNYALTRLLGARTMFTGSDDRASVDTALDALARELSAAGHRPYPIPRGGACALGTVGHVLAVAELAAQCAAQGIAPKAVVLAVGSGGTYAGWLAGTRALRLPWRIEGFTVSRPAVEARARVLALVEEAAALLQLDVRANAGDLSIHDGYIGGGYGVPTPEADAAIELAARREGTFLDPTYTGKAFAGLMGGACALAPSDAVVFVHTGGAPTLLARSGASA